MNSTLFSIIALIISIITLIISIVSAKDTLEMENYYTNGKDVTDWKVINHRLERLEKEEDDSSSFFIVRHTKEELLKALEGLKERVDKTEQNVKRIDHVQADMLKGMTSNIPCTSITHHISNNSKPEPKSEFFTVNTVTKKDSYGKSFYSPVVVSSTGHRMWFDLDLFTSKDMALDKAIEDVQSIRGSKPLPELRTYDF